MNLRLLLWMLPLLLLLTIGRAVGDQTSDGKAIDEAYQACLDKADTTVAEYGCIDAASKGWDKLLNANYKAAMARLGAADKKLLREAQRKWLAYREADFAFRGGSWTQGQGTMLGVILADTGLQILKARAQALENYGPLGD